SEGNSTSTSGNVTNKWFEYSANWPNYFTDMSTWNSAYPNGQKANGQYTIKAGINTSWFDLGFKSQSRTLSHVY
ncbi:MAG: hypothetical protein LBS74_09120, partial [Oscillospiraceae bacterium]|nr:hypothetical protein [Oscillospiraceae bacterium]